MGSCHTSLKTSNSVTPNGTSTATTTTNGIRIVETVPAPETTLENTDTDSSIESSIATLEFGGALPGKLDSLDNYLLPSGEKERKNSQLFRQTTLKEEEEEEEEEEAEEEEEEEEVGETASTVSANNNNSSNEQKRLNDYYFGSQKGWTVKTTN